MGLQSVLLDCIADIIYTYLKGGTNMSERELRIERRRVIREKREACQEILRCLFDSFLLFNKCGNNSCRFGRVFV